MRTQPDLDGEAFDCPDLITIPADGSEDSPNCLDCGHCESCINRSIAHMDSQEWWLHVPCNDRNGNFDGSDIDSLCVYIGGECALKVEGDPKLVRESFAQEESETKSGRHLKFYGTGRYPFHREANYVGNIHWNAYAMKPETICSLLSMLKLVYGWLPESGWTSAFNAMNSDGFITPAMILGSEDTPEVDEVFQLVRGEVVWPVPEIGGES